MEAEIKTNRKMGSRTLHVYYDKRLDDFNERIRKAKEKHNVFYEKMTVIALPIGNPASFADFSREGGKRGMVSA